MFFARKHQSCYIFDRILGSIDHPYPDNCLHTPMSADMHPEINIPAQRPQWAEEVPVVVPKLDRLQKVSMSIDPGSGIVAFQMRGMPGKIHVYYEGNRLGAQNLNSFEDRVMHAYGRMTKSYPTIAQAMMDLQDFDIIGTYSNGQLDIDADHPALKAWVAGDSRLEGRIEAQQAHAWRPSKKVAPR
jgi:hypothetical protein